MEEQLGDVRGFGYFHKRFVAVHHHVLFAPNGSLYALPVEATSRESVNQVISQN